MTAAAAKTTTKTGIIWNIVCVLVCIIFVPFIICSIYLSIETRKNPEKLATIFGTAPVVVLSGSMDPVFEVNDLIFIEKVDVNTLRDGDIICFYDDDMFVTHRISRTETVDGEKRFYTIGDFNGVEDKDYILAEQIQGIYTGRIPKLGGVILFIQDPYGLVLTMILLLLLFITGELIIEILEKRKMVKVLSKEIEGLRALLAEKESFLGAQEALIAEQASAFAAKAAEIAAMETELARLNGLIEEGLRQLAEKEDMLSEQEKELVAKDAWIAAQVRLLADRESQLLAKTAFLQEQLQEIVEKETLLAEKDMRIAEKDAWIAEQEQLLTERERRIIELEKQLIDQAEWLAAFQPAPEPLPPLTFVEETPIAAAPLLEEDPLPETTDEVTTEDCQEKALPPIKLRKIKQLRLKVISWHKEELPEVEDNQCRAKLIDKP